MGVISDIFHLCARTINSTPVFCRLTPCKSPAPVPLSSSPQPWNMWQMVLELPQKVSSWSAILGRWSQSACTIFLSSPCPSRPTHTIELLPCLQLEITDSCTGNLPHMPMSPQLWASYNRKLNIAYMGSTMLRWPGVLQYWASQDIFFIKPLFQDWEI